MSAPLKLNAAGRVSVWIEDPTGSAEAALLARKLGAARVEIHPAVSLESARELGSA
jgi:hypothetical protein